MTTPEPVQRAETVHKASALTGDTERAAVTPSTGPAAARVTAFGIAGAVAELDSPRVEIPPPPAPIPPGEPVDDVNNPPHLEV